MGEGAVDQRVDAAEALDGGLGEILAGGGIGDIGGHAQHFALRRDGADALLRLFQPRRTARADGHGTGSFAGSLQGELDAHSGADSGNHHDLVFQQHDLSSCCYG
ncbi:hypothetical protein D3C81_1202020 [compost metagenome]